MIPKELKDNPLVRVSYPDQVSIPAKRLYFRTTHIVKATGIKKDVARRASKPSGDKNEPSVLAHTTATRIHPAAPERRYLVATTALAVAKDTKPSSLNRRGGKIN